MACIVVRQGKRIDASKQEETDYGVMVSYLCIVSLVCVWQSFSFGCYVKPLNEIDLTHLTLLTRLWKQTQSNDTIIIKILKKACLPPPP